MFKKFLISFLLFTTLFTSVFAKPAFAQVTAPRWYHSSFQDWFLKVNDPNNPEDIYAERYTSAQVEWVFWGYFAFLINAALGTDLGYCVISNAEGLATTVSSLSILGPCRAELTARLQEIGEGLISFVPDSGSAIAKQSGGFFANVFASGRPISGITYVSQRLKRTGLVQEAFAQNTGFGYGAATPVRALWVAARDISYFLLVISLIVMAFMIMFRVKNSPQTVITIQSTLPKLIVGIVVITFSYAIAGLMIDLMYVVIGLVASLLQNSELFDVASGVGGWETMYGHLSGSQLGTGLVGIMGLYGILMFVASIANGIMTYASILIPGLGGILFVIVLFIAWIIIALKIVWALTKNFVTILLLIAGSPFMILSGVVGGSGFGGWLKTLAGHLAVYPAVGLLFAFSFFFLANSFPDWGIIADILRVIGTAGWGVPFDPNSTALTGTIWAPPFTAIGTSSNLIWFTISLILLSLIPKTVEIMQSMMSGKPFAYGSAVGAPIAAAGGFIGGVGGAAMGGIPKYFAEQRDEWTRKALTKMGEVANVVTRKQTS